MQHEAQPTKHLVQMRCCVTSERYIHFSPLLKWFVHKCLSRLQKCAQKNAQIMNTHDFIQISKKKKKILKIWLYLVQYFRGQLHCGHYSAVCQQYHETDPVYCSVVCQQYHIRLQSTAAINIRSNTTHHKSC